MSDPASKDERDDRDERREDEARREDAEHREEEARPGREARREDAEAKRSHAVNWLERLVSGTSLLLLLGAIGYLAWEGAQPDRPPSFEPVVREVRATPAGYDVLFDVHNGGDESVQNLAIEVEVRDGAAVLARAETTLSWLPAASSRTAAVIVAEDPREHELAFTFVGYELP